MLSRDPARSRPPTDRPLDIVALELLVCITQALLAGLLLSLATDLGGDARAAGLPIPGLLAILGLAVGAGWVWWLVGGSGWLLAAVDLAVALLTGALWLLSLQDQSTPHLDPLAGLLALSCAIYGIVAGVFLHGPRRGHWKGGTSQPRRGLPETRATPARFSPPVQRVVDERLANISLTRASLSAVRLPSVKLPGRDSGADPEAGAAGTVASPTTVSPRTATPGTASPGPVVASAGTGSPAPGSTGPGSTDQGTTPDVPTLIHRILTGDEPLSVSALRLSGIPAATPDLAPDEDMEDETLPVPTAVAGAPGAGGAIAPEDPVDAAGGGDTRPARDSG